MLHRTRGGLAVAAVHTALPFASRTTRGRARRVNSVALNALVLVALSYSQPAEREEHEAPSAAAWTT